LLAPRGVHILPKEVVGLKREEIGVVVGVIACEEFLGDGIQPGGCHRGSMWVQRRLLPMDNRRGEWVR